MHFWTTVIYNSLQTLFCSRSHTEKPLPVLRNFIPEDCSVEKSFTKVLIYDFLRRFLCYCNPSTTCFVWVTSALHLFISIIYSLTRTFSHASPLVSMLIFACSMHHLHVLAGCLSWTTFSPYFLINAVVMNGY